MFLHIVALDRQLSVHADEKKPLSKAVDEAFEYHGYTRRAELVAHDADGALDLKKTPAANGLGDDDTIYVLLPLPKPAKRKRR